MSATERQPKTSKALATASEKSAPAAAAAAPTATSSSSSSSATAPQAQSQSPADDEDDEDAPAGKSTEMTEEERAKKAAAKKKRKKDAERRKKASAAVAAAEPAAAASSSSGASDDSAEAAAAAMAALEASFPAHPMHAYFNEASGTRLQFTREKGRHVVATRPIAAGTAVFHMAAYASVVNDAFVHAFCARCFQTAPSMLCCAACQHTRFCSPRCQKAMANVHNLECAALGRLQKLTMESESAPIRMLIRICYLQQQEKLASDSQKAGGKPPSSARQVWLPKAGQSFADARTLISHIDSHSTEFKSAMLMVLNQIQERVIQDDAIWRSEELDLRSCLTIILQNQCNAHTITDQHKNRVGVGLFIPAAYLNHSCRPSCVYWFDQEGDMVMQSIRPIKVGEEVTYSYVDLYQSRASRAAILKGVYFIDACQCERCQKTQEKASEDALMRHVTCSACGPNPLLEFQAAGADTSAVAAGSSAWSLLKADKSGNNLHCTNSACGRIYKQADVAECISNAQRLSEQGTLMAQSGDFDDAIAYIESRVLYVAKAAAGQPFFHPYHAAIFNAYLHVLASLQAAPATRANLLQIVRYASAVLECLAAQRLDDHPEAADTILVKANALLALRKLPAPDSVREVPKLVRGAPSLSASLAALTVSSPSTSSSSSSTPASTACVDLLSSAYLHYTRAVAVRTICFGAAHELTKAAAKQAAAIQDEYERHSGRGIYNQNFADFEAKNKKNRK